MKENSTLSYQCCKKNQVKTYKAKNILRVKDETISIILAYSKSLSCAKTDLLGDVLIINN